MESRKVFIIGRPRTATASMAKALEILGYDTVEEFDRNESGTAEDVIEAAKDVSAFGFSLTYTLEDIRKIEAAYTDAVFILTEREADQWYSSFIRSNNEEATEEDPRTEELEYKNKGNWVNQYYKDYNEKVKAHFKGREWKLFNVYYGVKNDNWGNICSFLKKPIPNQPLPHVNMSRK
jgi:hypothetical protein